MRSVILAIVLATGLVTGCGKNTEPPPPSSGKFNAQPESGPAGARRAAPAQDGLQRAHERYANLCAMCHGADGTGHGPMAEKLDPKPRDYTDPKWQASVTDDDIKTILIKGGKGTGKNPMMPGDDSLAQDPELLDGLVKIVRGFAGHGPAPGAAAAGSSAP